MEKQQGTFAVKAGLAQMLKGGVIMDVTNVEEARIAEEAGAVAVMALERVPADIRRHVWCCSFQHVRIATACMEHCGIDVFLRNICSVAGDAAVACFPWPLSRPGGARPEALV